MGTRREGPFPALELARLGGGSLALASLFDAGDALLIVGHRGCKTTRQTLPYVDRLYRRRGPGRSVCAVLQDDAATARELADSLGLELPIGLEADPYPLAEALGLVAVPTLFLIRRGGSIARVVEGFVRAELEELAVELGAPPPLLTPEDEAPALRPG